MPLPTEKFASDTNGGGGVDPLSSVAPWPRVESDAALTEGAPEEMKRGRASISSLGASIYDVSKIFGILDPPLSAFGTNLQY